jgi:hypothetical protein
MAVHIKPCRRCPVSEGCPDKAALKAKVAGIGAVSVSFNCARLKAAMPVGRRIVILHPFFEEDDGDYERSGGVRHLPVNATITTVMSGHRFTCTVDATEDEDHEMHIEEKFRFRRAQFAYRIVRFLDEANRKICRNNNVVDADGVCDSRGPCHCDSSGDF